MILLIDGNFFAQRIRNAVGLSFIQKPDEDRATLIYECTKSLSSEVRRMGNLVTQIVIARDFSSWRKDVTQTFPIGHVRKDEAQKYKANRDEVEKDYDPEQFYRAYDEWVDLLEENLNIIVIKSYKAEADDIVHILSKELSTIGAYVLTWSSDGDYLQNVSDKIGLLKFPKRQLILNKYSQEFRKREFGDIFGMNGETPLKNFSKEFDQTDILMINPMESLFNKITSGDEKDNVPPIFIWKSSTGTTTFKPSARIFAKAFPETNKILEKEITLEEITEEQLYDFTYIRELIKQMFIAAKQIPGLDYKLKKKEFTPAYEKAVESDKFNKVIDHALEVYKSNLIVKHLSYKHIPQNIIEDVKLEYKNKIKDQNIETISVLESACKAINISYNEQDYFTKFDLENAIGFDPSKSNDVVNSMFG